MGIIVGLVLLVVTGAVLAGAVIKMKKCSGRKETEGSEFSYLNVGFKPRLKFTCLVIGKYPPHTCGVWF